MTLEIRPPIEQWREEEKVESNEKIRDLISYTLSVEARLYELHHILSRWKNEASLLNTHLGCAKVEILQLKEQISNLLGNQT